MPKFKIIIELEEMPNTCEMCPLDYDGICCSAVVLNSRGDKECRHHESGGRYGIEEWCPLKEVEEDE